MDQELMRIGVSLPDNLLTKFDKIIETRGYSSRSEGIRDAIRSYIIRHEWMGDVKGKRIGSISLIYDHSKRGLMNTLTDVQHEYAKIIKTSIHVHLDHDDCFEVIVLEGEGVDFKNLAEKIMSLKGVKYMKLNTAEVKKE
ncbi:MAG: nickel-responsive transcriptional regulator NikR [Methanosarcinaceae archaeon]|jgi:CopG family nickel-responsive transcriptional regulator|nr:nickel-responsive transcriptional regulator NikR [Methanosarcinaceae archaeon]NKQ39154.1 nickel-responsive transcriptional regulator NikR [Methanosarcinales archaeon]